MDMSLGDAASLVTLVLFVFYILGRIWTIQREKILIYESFEVENRQQLPDNIEDSNLFFDIDPMGEILSIVSTVPILKVNVFEIHYNEEMKLQNVNLVFSNNVPINANIPMYFKVTIPDILPAYKIQFQRFDYVKVSFNVGFNGKFGGMSPGGYKIQHTIKSFLYYMLR